MVIEELSTALARIIQETGRNPDAMATIAKRAGDTVILAGEEGQHMYVIQSGTAEILNDDMVLDTVGPGGVIGEMALVDGSLRSATVRATENLVLMPISTTDFEALTRHHPEFGLYVMKIMSLRLRLMNARLGDAVEDIAYREKIEGELRAMATRDPLTGISNRQHFAEMASREIDSALRHDRHLSVAMIDVDHFKAVNDTYGHPCGDAALRTLVETAASELRSADIFGRLGGEEFALLLPETDAPAATAIAERIRARLARESLSWNAQTFSITVSIGVSSWRQDETNIDAALTRADNNLYAAKAQGRNRVVSE